MLHSWFFNHENHEILPLRNFPLYTVLISHTVRTYIIIPNQMSISILLCHFFQKWMLYCWEISTCILVLHVSTQSILAILQSGLWHGYTLTLFTGYQPLLEHGYKNIFSDSDHTNISEANPSGSKCYDNIWIGCAPRGLLQYNGSHAVVRRNLSVPPAKPGGTRYTVSDHCPIWAGFAAVKPS